MYPYHFHHLAPSSGDSGSSFWGAFLGAFFAFLFGLVMFYYTKKREGYIRHKNALVKLERLLNEHADELVIAKQLADTTKEALQKKALTDYRFKPLKLQDELTLELQSLDIINGYFLYARSISRLNMDLVAKNHALDKFEDAMIADRKIADESWNYITASMTEISGAIEERIDHQMFHLLAKVRIYLRNIRELNPIIYGVFRSDRDFEISDGEIRADIKKLEKEVEQLRHEAKENIKKFGGT